MDSKRKSLFGAEVRRVENREHLRSGDGKAFMRASGEAWAAAHAASGEDADEARARAERTIAFYTGG